METRFLETFLMVVEHGSLAEASRRLGITPGAVAQRMQALEEEFGTALLTRLGRRVRPTAAGTAIVAKSRQLVTDVRHLHMLAAGDAPAGELRLGAISTALTGLLAPALRQLRETIPSVTVFVLPGTSSALYQQVVDESIDAALIVEPPFPVLKALQWRLVRSEEMTLLAPLRWAREEARTLLSTRPFLRYDRNNWGGRLVDRYLRNANIAPREWLELDSLEAIQVMVANELGVSVAPDWARPTADDPGVARLVLPQSHEPRRIGLLWRSNAPSSRLVTALLDALKRRQEELAQARGG